MGQDEVEVFMCRFTCSVWSTLRNAKHEPSRGVWGHAPRKFLKKTCSEIKSGAFWTQNCYAKDRLWKSAVRALLAHKNSFFPVCESSFYKAGSRFLLCFDDQLAYTNNKRLPLYWYRSEANRTNLLEMPTFSFSSKFAFGKLERLWWPKLKGNGGRTSSHSILLNITWI